MARARRWSICVACVALAAGLALPVAAAASEVGCPGRIVVPEAQAAFYDGSFTSCSLPLSPGGLYAAVSSDVWASSAACGRCLRVSGPLGAVTVLVADQCPACAPEDLDLSAAAFAAIANPSGGPAPIAWETVACEVGDDPLQLEFEGSHAYYLKVQVQRHRHGIAGVDFHDASSSTWTPMARTLDNHFTVSGGEYTTPLSFRIHGIQGQEVEVQAAEIVNDVPIDTGVQLLPCPEPGAAGAAAAGAALAGLAAGTRDRRGFERLRPVRRLRYAAAPFWGGAR